MDGLVAAVVVAVGVNLQVQRKTLHSLLRGEVCAQTVDGDEDLQRERMEGVSCSKPRRNIKHKSIYKLCQLKSTSALVVI